MSRSRFLCALAFVVPPLAACGGATPAPEVPVAPTASTTTVATPTTVEPPSDPTAGGGPCRCSWETNQAAAPRVCKKNEMSYKGAPCVPSAHGQDDDIPVGGPLAPPELV